MKTVIAESFRRKLRLAVHRACMRRYRAGGNAVAASLRAEPEIAELLAAGGEEPPPSAEVVERWIEEDEADFDRAVLVSELLSDRQPVVSESVAGRKTPRVSAEEQETIRPPARSAGSPSITDLLDDMFAQQAPARRR